MPAPQIPKHSPLTELAFAKAEAISIDRSPILKLYQDNEVFLEEKSDSATLFRKKIVALCSVIRQYSTNYSIDVPIFEPDENEFEEQIDSIALFERRIAFRTFIKPDLYYDTQLTKLEDICSGILRDNKHEHISPISGLISTLGACGNGLHGHINAAHGLIYSEFKIPYLLSMLRELIIHQISDYYELNFSIDYSPGNSIHYHNRLMRYAAENGYNPCIEMIAETKDDFDTVILDLQTQGYFSKYFFERYSPSAIIECLESNISTILQKVQQKFNVNFNEKIIIQEESHTYSDIAEELISIPMIREIWGSSYMSALFDYNTKINEFSLKIKEEIKMSLIDFCRDKYFKIRKFKIDANHLLYAIPGCADISYIQDMRDKSGNSYLPFILAFNELKLWKHPAITPDFFRTLNFNFPLSNKAFINYYSRGITNFSYCDLTQIFPPLLCNPIAFLYAHSRHNQAEVEIKGQPNYEDFIDSLPNWLKHKFQWERNNEVALFDNFMQKTPGYPDCQLTTSMVRKKLNLEHAELSNQFIEYTSMYHDFKHWGQLDIKLIINFLQRGTTHEALKARLLNQIGYDLIIHKLHSAPSYIDAFFHLFFYFPAEERLPFLMRFEADNLIDLCLKNQISIVTLLMNIRNHRQTRHTKADFLSFIEFLGPKNLNRLARNYKDVFVILTFIPEENYSVIFQLFDKNLFDKNEAFHLPYYKNINFFSVHQLIAILRYFDGQNIRIDFKNIKMDDIKWIFNETNHAEQSYFISLFEKSALQNSISSLNEMFELIKLMNDPCALINAYGEEEFCGMIKSIKDIHSICTLLNQIDSVKLLYILDSAKLATIITDCTSLCDLLSLFSSKVQMTVLALLTPNNQFNYIKNDQDLFSILLRLTDNRVAFLALAEKFSWLTNVSAGGLMRMKSLFAIEDKGEPKITYLTGERLRLFRSPEVEIKSEEIQLILGTTQRL